MKREIFTILSFTFLVEVALAQENPVSTKEANTGLKQESVLSTSNATTDTNTELNTLKSLRKEGKLDKAEGFANQYLEKHPDDADFMFILSLIYVQKHKDNEAEKYLNKVLIKTPSYMDARFALIRLNIKNKKLKEAETLIRTGLSQDAKNAELLSLQKKLKMQLKHQDPTQVLAEIKALRQESKFSLAKEKALTYLKENPDDLDITLMLGLIYYNQHDYNNSEIRLKAVLAKMPKYLDARLALIKIKLIQKDYNEAQKLLDEGLSISPNEKQLLDLKSKLKASTIQKNLKKTGERRLKKKTPEMVMLQQAKYYLRHRETGKAKAIYQTLIKTHPCNVDFYIALADYYLERHIDQVALSTIKRALATCYPHNLKLLLKKGEIQTILKEYPQAAKSYQKVLALDPKNKVALDELNNIRYLSPRYLYGLNEIGAWTDNAYVSDLKKNWDWSNLYYARDTDWGRAILRLGYASRLSNEGSQYELNLLPRVNRDIYLDLVAASSNKPALFPNVLLGAEGYYNIPQAFELSAGAKHAKIERTYFNTYTGSINFYPGLWWLSFRPYYFVPKDTKKSTMLYTARIRRYFSTDDHFIGIGAGSGRSPDLADLLTVNFIVIRNNFVNAGYTFPLCNHQILVDLGVGYQRWVYPSGLVRNLYDGSIGLRYRF